MAIDATIPGAHAAGPVAGNLLAPGARSTAMWLMPLAAGIEALITLNVMLSIGFIPPMVMFLVILIGIAALGLARPGGKVYLLGGVCLAVFVAMNLPFTIDGLIHPIGTSHAWADIISIVVGVAGAIAGIAAYLELRRGRAVVRAMRSPVGDVLVVLVTGLLIGTTYASVLGFGALAGSPGLGVVNGVLQAPTQPPVELVSTGSVFTQKTLRLDAGPGTVYVVNSDAGPHTFDIELNGRVLSYPVPGRSTTAVVLDLTAGIYTYWCAIPGHRSTMEGTLEVAE